MDDATIPAKRVREDFVWVYQKLGGREALYRWAEDNAKEFFKTFFSLIQRAGEAEETQGELLRALRDFSEDAEGHADCPDAEGPPQ